MKLNKQIDLKIELAQLIEIIHKLAEHSKRALKAGSTTDEPATRFEVDGIRHSQARLERLSKETRDKVDLLASRDKQAIAENLNAIQSAKGFTEAWAKRYRQLIPFESLSQSPEGRDAVIDYSLPLAWDFQRDVMVLIGMEQTVFVDALNARGQSRILLMLQDGDAYANARGNVSIVRSAKECSEYFLRIENLLPERVSRIDDGQEHEAAWGDVRQAFALFLSNNSTTTAFGARWLMQGLMNLPNIARSTNLKTLKDAVGGLPVVIISPGPSLDKNIHLLRELKGRAILMAAVQSTRALLKAGVVPDLVVIADPGDLSYMLDGVDISQVGALIAGVSCHPRFYELGFKNVINFNANADIDTWISDIFGDTLPISSAGSVTIDCLYMAQYLECKTIVMVGLDLAIKDGRQYSEQSPNGESLAVVDQVSNTFAFKNVSGQLEKTFNDKGIKTSELLEPVLTLPGYYGGTVITRPNYHLFHGELVRIAAESNKNENATELINCTEGGAYIEGFDHCTLQSVVERLADRERLDLCDLIEKSCSLVDYKKRSILLAEKTKTITEKCSEISTLSEQCLQILKKNTYDHASNTKLMRIEREIIYTAKTLPMLSMPSLKTIQDALEITNLNNDLTSTNEAAKIIYTTIIDNSKLISRKLSNNNI